MNGTIDPRVRPTPTSRSLREAGEPRVGSTFRDRVRATSKLVAGILHEFNTPLGALRSSVATAGAAISRLASAIEHDPEHALAIARQLEQIFAVARVATDRIVDTVEALAHFARVDRAEVDEVDAAELVETALRLSGVSRNQGVRVNRRVDAPGLRLWCRVREIEHVLYHVIRNAHEAVAGRKDATIDVEFRHVDGGVVITVRDNGPGIDPEKLPTLFEPALTTKGSIVGLGLNLATCRYIAAEHGGALEAENEPDGGARFTFRFREVPAPV